MFTFYTNDDNLKQLLKKGRPWHNIWIQASLQFLFRHCRTHEKNQCKNNNEYLAEYFIFLIRETRIDHTCRFIQTN